MAIPFGLDVAMEVLSGAGLAAVGVSLFFVRTRRIYTMVFAFFLVLWGALVLSDAAIRTLVTVAAFDQARLWLLFRTAVLVDAYAPLVYFASVYPVRRGLARHWSGAALLVGPAVAGTGLLVTAPRLFHRNFRVGSWIAGTGPGPLTQVYEGLFAVAFLYAIYALYRHHAASRTKAERRRALGVLAAFLLWVGFTSARGAADVGLGVAASWPTLPPATTAARAALDLAGVAVTATVGLGVARGPGDRAPRFATLVAAVAALAIGAASVGGIGVLLSGSDAVAIWRLVAVLVIAYAIIRFETFTVEVRVARTAVGAGVLGASVAFALVLHRVLVAVDVPGDPMILTQSVLFGLLVVVALSAGRSEGWIARLLDRVSEPRRLERRRLEVYEAALAQAVAEGWTAERRSFVEDLRKRLGLSRAEHEVLHRLVGREGSDAPPELETGDTIGDRYVVREVLGEGTSGRVVRARDDVAERDVVVKVAKLPSQGRPERVRTFLHEARLAAEVDHPSTLRVLDVGSAGGVPFLVTEHVDGGTLRDLLDARGRLPTSEAVRVARGILDGLAALHERGIVHRDVKPANVLLTRDGRPKIGDFGIAARPDPRETGEGLGDLGPPRGTPSTMAPEAIRGEPPHPSMDVYSAAATLYEMLAGRPYLDLDGRTGPQMRRRILEDAPDPLPDDVPEELAAVVLRGLAKDRKDRFASAEEMAEALRVHA